MIQIDRGAVAVVTIDRPEVRNALDIPTLLELEGAFTALEGDDGVRAIVVTGAGDRAFVAGGDIGDLNSRQGLAHYREFAEVIHRVFRRVERCPKPTVGAVRGYALGGGVELLLALDIRILGRSARLGVPEITLGLFPGAGGTQRLIRQIPLCRAKELMMTGDAISAEEAVAIGLANRVVSDEDVVAAAREVAERIAQRSPLVLSMLKRTLAEGAEMPPSAALAFEQAMIGLVLDSADAHEGCSAFLERRPPQFTGS
ncbi:MAG: enoyl-CoA hydratase [Actinomycetota bacterium]|nr:enoyl-CoA hydratase [Actinomycetota bacterium]